jgi:anti-sigma regulatory factor (Ser/Thr protein kinase)
MFFHTKIPVADVSSIGVARRAATTQAAAAGLNEADAGRAAIVASELATNLVRHARPPGGMILIATAADAVEILSVDRGPGIADVARSFQDGYSTAGTPGNGLGAVRRLSNECDLFSAPSGTVLWCRVTAGAPTGRFDPQSRVALRAGVISTCAPGETVCGDAWRVARSADDAGRVSLMIADGLGHGPLAADAADAACASFDAQPFAAPGSLIETMHTSIGGTRGAAVAVARIDPAAAAMTFAGVGNIAGTLLAPDGQSRGLFSHNGTVGHQVRKVQPFDYPYPPGSLLVLHSDGLQTRWTLEAYPGLVRRHPAVIAGVLHRDFCRGRDDATAVVIAPPAT